MNDQISHPYKKDKILILCILVFIFFWIANWETKDSASNDSKLALLLVPSQMEF